MPEFEEELQEQVGMKVSNEANVGVRIVVWICFFIIAGVYGVILYWGLEKGLPIFRKFEW